MVLSHCRDISSGIWWVIYDHVKILKWQGRLALISEKGECNALRSDQSWTRFDHCLRDPDFWKYIVPELEARNGLESWDEI